MSFLKIDAGRPAQSVIRALAFVLLLSGTVSAQPFSGISHKNFLPNSVIQGDGVVLLSELNQELKILNKALSFGDNIAVHEEMEKLDGWKKRLGSKNLFFVSRYLIAKADQSARTGDFKQALQTARYATQVSPDDYNAQAALARHGFSLDKADPKGYLMPLISATLLYFSDPVGRQIFISRTLKIIAPALFLAYCIFIIAILVFHRKPFANDLDRFLPFLMRENAASIALLLVAVAIILYGGIFWLVILLPIFLRSYMKKSAVAATVVFLAYLAILPFAVTIASRGEAIENSSLNRMVNDYLNGNFDPEMINEFSGASALDPKNGELLFALANLHRWIGSYDKAENFLLKLPEFEAEKEKMLVEQGNIHLGRKEYSEAELMYNKALERSPSLVEAHYNLSVAYTGQFRTEDAAAAFNTAMSIDKEKTMRFVKMGGGDTKTPNVVSLASDLKRMPLFEKSPTPQSEEMANSIWNAFIGDITMKMYLKGVVAYIALLIASIFIWGKFETSTLCSSCGKTFIPVLRSGNLDKLKCNPCLIATSSKKNVLRSKKDKKTKAIREYQYGYRETANRLNLLLPGLGSVFAGSCLIGAIALFITSIFILKALLILLPLVAGGTGALSAHVAVYAAWGTALVLFYLFSLVALRMEL